MFCWVWLKAKLLFQRLKAHCTVTQVETNIDLENATTHEIPVVRSLNGDTEAQTATLSLRLKDLRTRYQQSRNLDDLNETIVLGRKALLLLPPGHPHRPASLHNLALDLSCRYARLGAVDDMNESIDLCREALLLFPPEHPHRKFTLNLPNHLSSQHKRPEGIDDMNRAIILCRKILSLFPPGFPNRSTFLDNLAGHLYSRYEQLGEIDCLNEAIILSREALSLHPPGHPGRSRFLYNLALALFSRYKQLGGIDGLGEAIVLNRGALSLCPPGHRDLSRYLNTLANYLFSRYEQLGGIDDLNEAILLDWKALSFFPPGHSDRPKSLNNLATHSSSWHKIEGKHSLSALYAELQHIFHTASTADLLGSRESVDMAEDSHHPTALAAYETAFRFLVEDSSVLPSLPVDAFSTCLRNQSSTNAIELLEQGRGVFWTQLARLRSPLNQVSLSGPEGKVLADEYTRLTSLLRMVFHFPTLDQHDRILRICLEGIKVISDIRELRGFSRLFLPSLFSELQSAARDGPVIIVNASEHECDALIVFFDKDPVHIPLPVTKEDIRGLLSNLYTLRQLVAQRRVDVTTGYQSFLRELWDRVVSHIMDVLRRTCPPQSRIWWCPTAEFSLLPLHAAAPYRKDQEGVFDLFISSYTTTLTALIHARRPDVLKPDRKHFIAIGQAQSPGFSKLHFINTELANIERHVKPVTTFTRVKGRDGRVSAVAGKLSQNEWVHFACHGFSDQERPFKSGFALYDGAFTIKRIIRCNLQNPEFAYLSACQTTVGDEENPDEVIHLASSMLFAGFRSVVGTMWSVADSPATKVASKFYELMVDESGGLDHTRAAWALWKTLKTVDIPMDQRILYIHLGA